MDKRFAIIGFGCAGYHAAKAIRGVDRNATIDVYERSGKAGANPWLSTYYVGGQIEFARMFPFGCADDVTTVLGIRFLPEDVVRIDADALALETGGGDHCRYDAILVATGASPLTPDALACEDRPVFVMRTASDANKLKRYLEEGAATTAIVLGASMVGIKVAELLHRRGIKTTLMDVAPTLFPLAAYPKMAAAIATSLRGQGLNVSMGVKISAVNAQGVVLDDGASVAADIVCLCIGMRASLDFVTPAQTASGSRIEVKRGIVVNGRMETSVAGIYAAGDCCEGANLQSGETAIFGLWANAAAQGACAGRNMAGAPTEYRGSFSHNVTRFFGMTFVGIGDPRVPGTHKAAAADGFVVEAVRNGERLCSMNILGECRVSGIFKSIMHKHLTDDSPSLTTTQKGLLANAGVPKDFVEFIEGFGQ